MDSNTPSCRQSTAVVLILSLLVLSGAGCSGKSGKPDPGETKNTRGPSTPAAECSDDADRKPYDTLHSGEPIKVPFDRGALDALKDRPIPEVEVYGWQPEGLVAVFGEHRMRGNLLALHPDG